MSGTERQACPPNRPAKRRGSAGAASWLGVLAVLLAIAPASAQQLGDFGRLKSGVVNDEILPLVDQNRMGTNGRPLHGMNVTDEEIEMRDRVWRFLAAPYVQDWAWPYSAEIRPASAGGGTEQQIGKYYRWLGGQHYASSHVRYRTIGEHAEADLVTLPETFRSICTVIEIDRQRGVAVAEIDGLDAKLLARVDQRDRDNGEFISRFVLALSFRYDSYQYALDHLLVETPSREAVEVDNTLWNLSTWVQRAQAHDFCSAAHDAEAGGRGALPSRVLLDPPSEGEIPK